MVAVRGQDRFANSVSEGVNIRNTKAQFALVQEQMQDCLCRLGVNLNVKWQPDCSKSVHGEIKGNVILLYDSNEAEAWLTFTHEITEYKLQNVTRPYRLMINSLIDALEKSVYAEKEQFIDFLPKMMEAIKENQAEARKN